MNAAKRESWRRVRERGRDRFLIVNTGYFALGFGIAFTLFYVALALFGRNPLWSVREIVASWALLSLLVGAIEGLREWNKNEKEYGEPNYANSSSS